MSSARNAGESAIRRVPAQPSAEIVRVECAKCRRDSGCPRNPLRRSCVSSARNAGESAIREITAQPSAEIVRVECAKCRRERDWCNYRATLCGDRACRVREMQARVRCVKCDPLRRSCVPSARNAGESAIRLAAEQAVESVEVEAENWGLCSTTLVCGVAGELEAENWTL